MSVWRELKMMIKTLQKKGSENEVVTYTSITATKIFKDIIHMCIMKKILKRD